MNRMARTVDYISRVTDGGSDNNGEVTHAVHMILVREGAFNRLDWLIGKYVLPCVPPSRSLDLLAPSLSLSAPHCTALHRTAPHCTALHRTAPPCTALHRSARVGAHAHAPMPVLPSETLQERTLTQQGGSDMGESQGGVLPA